MADKADVARKVKALLAVAADGSGATPAEAATAAALAAKLTTQHGLVSDDFKDAPRAARAPRREPHMDPSMAPHVFVRVVLQDAGIDPADLFGNGSNATTSSGFFGIFTGERGGWWTGEW